MGLRLRGRWWRSGIAFAFEGFVVEVLADEAVLDFGGVGEGCEFGKVDVAEAEGKGHIGGLGGATCGEFELVWPSWEYGEVFEKSSVWSE